MFNKPNFTYDPEQAAQMGGGKGMGDIYEMGKRQVGFDPAQAFVDNPSMLAYDYMRKAQPLGMAEAAKLGAAPGSVMGYIASPAKGSTFYDYVQKNRGKTDV